MESHKIHVPKHQPVIHYRFPISSGCPIGKISQGAKAFWSFWEGTWIRGITGIRIRCQDEVLPPKFLGEVHSLVNDIPGLVNVYITNWKDPPWFNDVQWVNPRTKSPFSRAILTNYQRVQCGSPQWCLMVYKPHENYSYRYHKPEFLELYINQLSLVCSLPEQS